MSDHPSMLMRDSYDHDQREVGIDGYEEDGPACYHGCFGVFRFPWKQSSSENEGKHLLGGSGCNFSTKEVTWWRKKLNKAREFTEVYGGPKWKNLVRKIGAYCRRCRKRKVRLCEKKKPKNRFQYDMNSYNLNFDNGSEGRDGENPVANFSARFAAPSSLVSQQGPVVGVHASEESEG
ncbi:hypothetical protein RchiOBHm_Chr2g0086671 [Rosa chinensis]|uniref:Uncharacterized protein n=1 Tax=Rosa chinensis TaxID=74649 RepID=A0A2P6RIG5_ROSCH|nr:hypothetical protein RchiOBHm_Chr2g0086671 [Rosa chinensis]